MRNKVNIVIEDGLLSGTYNLGFNGNDETQFDADNAEDLRELWVEFCKENGLDPECIDYCAFVGDTKSLYVDINLTSAETFDLTIGDPESGECLTICCHDNGKLAPEENERVMREIRSWVSLMRESC